MDKTRLFENWLYEYAKKTDFSGNVRIISKGKTIFSKAIGFADRENKIPLTEDTKFRIYSLTKPFTAISIMQFYEKGLIDLDAHPSKYLPCAKVLDPRITIRRLLQHSSGLKEFTLPEDTHPLVRLDMKFFENALLELSKQPLDFMPGADKNYRNSNFAILSLVVEALSEMPMEEYLKKNVFEPLGMKTATCDIGNIVIKNKAVGYEKIGDEILPARPLNMSLLLGGAIGVATLDDIECLHKEIKNPKLLKKETWELILTRADISSFGLGCAIGDWYGYVSYQHNGGHYGFRSLHLYLPEIDFDIIILCNSGYGEPRGEISDKIHSIYFTQVNEPSSLEEMDKGFV